MSKCLIAEYETMVAAKACLETLEHGHFTIDKISVVSSASDPAAEHLQHLQHLQDESVPATTSASAPEGRSTSLGMLIGGTLAAPIAAGTLVGPLIIAGPLVGVAVGATVGNLLGGMARWGVSDDVSDDYEQRVGSGSVLVIVHDVDKNALDDAGSLLEATKPISLEKHELETTP